MSGGVDSSVAAALLKQRGREVVGISLQLWNYSADSTERFGTCCSLDDLGDARRVADRVGIPFYILNMEKEFEEEVVDYFVSEYLKARTPIPCTLCNQRLKFDHLISRAEGLLMMRRQGVLLSKGVGTDRVIKVIFFSTYPRNSFLDWSFH